MDAKAHTVSPSTIARYAVGSLGTGGFATLPGLVLVYYMTDTLGVAPLVAGLVVTLAKVFDVVIDPVIGARSDHSLAASGSRRRLMVIGALALPLFFVLTFAVPGGVGPLGAATWVTIAFVLCAVSFSLFQVPYIALPAELTSGYDERTRLLTWRVVVLTIAILLFGAGGPILRGLGDDPRLGYLLMAIVAGVVIGAGMLVSSGVAPTGPSLAVHPRVSLVVSYREGIGALHRSQPFRALLATFVLQGLATGLMLAAAQYVATWVLRSEDAVTLLFVALIAPALLLAPVWGRISARFGKHLTFIIASGVFALACISLTALLWAPGPWAYLSVALAGSAYAGMQSLPMAMLPDVISHDGRAYGDGRAGVFGGVWTAGETMGMAFGATVLTVVLAVGGYLESSAGDVVEQPAAAVAGIVLSFSIVPAAFMAASMLTLRRYGLRRHDTESLETEAAA